MRQLEVHNICRLRVQVSVLLSLLQSIEMHVVSINVEMPFSHFKVRCITCLLELVSHKGFVIPVSPVGVCEDLCILICCSRNRNLKNNPSNSLELQLSLRL